MNHSTQSQSVTTRSVGDLLDTTFRQYRSHFAFIMTATAVVLVPYLALDVIFTRGDYGQLQNTITALMNAKSPISLQQTLSTQGSLQGIATTWVLLLLGALIVTPLLYGTLVDFASRLFFKHQTTTVQDAISHAFRRLTPTFITLVLTGLVYVIGIGVLSTLMFLIVSVLGSVGGGAALAATFTAIITIALMAAVIWLTVRLAFVPAVVMAEDHSMFQALTRSWVLTRRRFWRTVGFFVLVLLITNVVQGGVDTFALLFVHNSAASMAISRLVDLFTTPFTLLAFSNLYIDLRVRSDALDIRQRLDGRDDTHSGL